MRFTKSLIIAASLFEGRCSCLSARDRLELAKLRHSGERIIIKRIVDPLGEKIEDCNTCIYEGASSFGVPEELVVITYECEANYDDDTESVTMQYRVKVEICDGGMSQHNNSTTSTLNTTEITEGIKDSLRESGYDPDDGHLLIEVKPYAFQLEEHVTQGGVLKLSSIPWVVLNDWLSMKNGYFKPGAVYPKDLRHDDVLVELERRRVSKKNETGETSEMEDGSFRIRFPSEQHLIGFGKDWREHENDSGYSHLEELFLYQPSSWKKLARIYLFRHQCDLNRKSRSTALRSVKIEILRDDKTMLVVRLNISTPLLMVLFHPRLERISRYDPLRFLLSHGAFNPLPNLLREMVLDKDDQQLFLNYISPLNYFLDFRERVATYNVEILSDVADAAGAPRLRFMTELDFSEIVGQRLAKGMIREQVVTYFRNRCRKTKSSNSPRHSSPLCMIFAGPSGSGKTELAHELSVLLNGPSTNAFLKIDCGKMQHSTEVFGLSGAYQGSYLGSELNNFVVRMAREPEKVGVVLLDEFDKCNREVIEGFYQVFDKGEWTDKKLNDDESSQTSVVPCHNIIFIMTVNLADSEIERYIQEAPSVYTDVLGEMRLHQRRLEMTIQTRLQQAYPFTKAFVGRLDAFVPFFPLSLNSGEDADPLELEMMTIAKLLIEKEMDSLERGSDLLQVRQFMSPSEKHELATLVVETANPDSGVRSVQKVVSKEMGNRLMHEYLLDKGGIDCGSHIRYHVEEEERYLSFRQTGSSENTSDAGHEKDDGNDESVPP